MLKQYDNVLSEDLMEEVMDYFNTVIDKDLWGSSIGWDQHLCPVTTSHVLTHTIRDISLGKRINDIVQQTIKVRWNNVEFIPTLYVWSGGSYITWHRDEVYPYSGTIFLNKEWDSDNGGIFLYKDEDLLEVKGIEPIYNSMVVNSAPHSPHCVTCIVPGTVKKRITIQWRTCIKSDGDEKVLMYQ